MCHGRAQLRSKLPEENTISLQRLECYVGECFRISGRHGNFNCGFQDSIMHMHGHESRQSERSTPDYDSAAELSAIHRMIKCAVYKIAGTTTCTFRRSALHHCQR
jgi:hypothetical protein